MSSKPDNYTTTVPEGVDKTKEEWLQLSYDTQYYHANGGANERRRENRRKRRRKKSEWVNSIKSNSGCTDCGEDNPVCLEFHHIDDKDAWISDMVRNEASNERIQEEIDKCIVLCANCHRKRHHDRKI